MPLLLDAARRLLDRHPDTSLHAAHVSDAQRERMAAMAAAHGVPLEMHGDDVHGVMASCRAAFVASGTATLETALFGTPLVVFYRVPKFEYRIGELLLIPPFIGQVNLISGRELTPEIITWDDDATPLVEAMEPLLTDSDAWHAQKQGLESLRSSSRGPGAIALAAELLAPRFSRSAASPTRAPGQP